MAQNQPSCAVCTFNATPTTHWDDGSTRVQQLMSSTRMTTEDMAALKDDKVVVRARLAELDALILDTRTALQRLVDTRAGVAAAMNNIAAALSPIQMLPDDILLSIFLFCAPRWDDSKMRCWDGGEAGIGEDSLFDDHWTVAQVCRRWRAVSLSHGPLWTSLLLPCDCGSPKRRAATRTLVQRSKGAELSVEVYNDCYSRPCQGIPFSMFAERCKRLCILDVRCCMAQTPVVFPCLSSFVIVYGSSVTPDRLENIIVAPQLVSYEEHCPSHSDALPIALESTRIRQLKITDSGPARILKYNLSAITTLTLEQLTNLHAERFRGRLHFPSVCKLRLVGSEAYNILGYTTMPQLEALELCLKAEWFGNHEDDDLSWCTLPMFASPPDNLTQLKITHYAEYGCRFLEGLSHLFEATANVTDLRLFIRPNEKWEGRAEDAIDLLDANHGLLPRLKTLWLGNLQVVRENLATLENVITSRRGTLAHFGIMDVPDGLVTRWDEEHLATLKGELESSETYIDLGMEILI